jgi:argininosuccinate lyase
VSDKAWGGRFAKDTDSDLAAFARSLPLDQRLWPYDLALSTAHARMLAAQGIIDGADGARLVDALVDLATAFERGEVSVAADQEDIHMAIEALLFERVGDVAGRLHTGRSRNDQVATDLHLYLRRVAVDHSEALTALMAALVARADEALAAGVVLPGYTHTQHAQPVLLAHHWLAHFEALDRDRDRLADLARRANRSPLGAAALAGSPHPLDSTLTARLLGFDGPYANSLDAVADRDFIAEYLAFAALCGVHLSRMAEEAVLWTSAEFQFAVLDDDAAFGSSLMPQKKNPEAFEHVRGRSGRLLGVLAGFLATLKALPLAYDSDLQESHYALYTAADTLGGMLGALARLLASLAVRPDAMARAAADPLMLATDAADLLVKRGVPFRAAHRQIGELVAVASERGVGLADLDRDTFATHAPALTPEDLARLTAAAAVAARATHGGTAPARVAEALAAARARLAPPALPPPPPTAADVARLPVARPEEVVS